MMFCKFCGVKIDSDSVFCKECGKKQQTQINPIQPAETVQSVESTPNESKSTILSKKRICPKCGMSNPSSYYSCANCHTCITKAHVVVTEQIVKKNPSKTCPNCGINLNRTSYTCPRCNTNLSSGDHFLTQKTYSTQYDSSSSQGSNVFLYILSFIIPLFGIIFGAIYLSKDEENKKHIGKVCLITGLISCVLMPIVFSFIMISGLTSMTDRIYESFDISLFLF